MGFLPRVLHRASLTRGPRWSQERSNMKTLVYFKNPLLQAPESLILGGPAAPRLQGTESSTGAPVRVYPNSAGIRSGVTPEDREAARRRSGAEARRLESQLLAILGGTRETPKAGYVWLLGEFDPVQFDPRGAAHLVSFGGSFEAATPEDVKVGDEAGNVRLNEALMAIKAINDPIRRLAAPGRPAPAQGASGAFEALQQVLQAENAPVKATAPKP